MKPITDKLVDCLEDAQQLISATPAAVGQETSMVLENLGADYEKLSPLKKLANIFSRNITLNAEPIRIIQHFSCTGGTLFGKCIAAMPNIVLLSEIHPLSTQLFLSGGAPKFCPTDIISLARIGKAPAIEDLSKALFLEEMRVTQKHLSEYGQRLVLREHSHSSFLAGKMIAGKNTIPQLLDPNARQVSIITVRHPLDSYLSLQHNNWIHFEPATLDEYCRRYLLFISSNAEAPVFKYEDLLDNTEIIMQQICDHFVIPFNPDFLDYLEIVDATGDSGRSSIHVGKRTRRPVGDSQLTEAKISKNYATLCTKLDYKPL